MTRGPGIDRRAARTQAALHRALMSLILKKPYEAITITDVCKAANVSRSTFYAHFADKDDLKRSGLDTMREEVTRNTVRTLDVEGGAFGFSLAMLEHARDHLHHYQALVGTHGGTVALDRIRKIISDLVREEIKAVAENRGSEETSNRVLAELYVQHFVGAFMAV